MNSSESIHHTLGTAHEDCHSKPGIIGATLVGTVTYCYDGQVHVHVQCTVRMYMYMYIYMYNDYTLYMYMYIIYMYNVYRLYSILYSFIKLYM